MTFVIGHGAPTFSPAQEHPDHPGTGSLEARHCWCDQMVAAVAPGLVILGDGLFYSVMAITNYHQDQ